MKKIVSILLVIVFLSSNFSFAEVVSNMMCTPTCNNDQECYDPGEYDAYCRTITETTSNQASPTPTNNCDGYSCPGEEAVTMTNNECKCNDLTNATPPEVLTTPATTSSTAVMGISCSSEQLLNGQCKLNIYDTLGIRKSVRNPGDRTSVGLFVQDIVLSATFFIGTLVTIALVVSGLMFIFAASSGKDPTSAKQGIIGSLIGLLVVVSSYIIIRLVQYLARGF